MNSEKLIQEILRSGESEQIEFKRSGSDGAIAKVVCSFLNGEGGQLLIGIEEPKEIVGVPNADVLVMRLRNFLMNNIVPEAPISVAADDFGGKKIVSVKVYAGAKQPYVFDGSIYYRRGNSTVKASSKEISELIHGRQVNDVHWERQPSLGVRLSDLDQDEIQATIEASVNQSRSESIGKAPLDFLSYYGLESNGNFTNAAVVLFAKNPTRFLPQCRVRLSFLQEGKTGSAFKDDRFLEGNVFANVRAIEDFFRKHLEIRRTFSDKIWQREDDFQYPMAALREGVMNALVHRDYSNPSGIATITIYPDKLEITNSGELSLKPSELKRSHLSIPANPDIAQVVFLRGYIERIGRGTLKIIDACKEVGLETPVWSKDSNSVKLTFFSNPDVYGVIDGIIDGVIEGATDTVRKRLKQIIAVLMETEGVRTDYLNEKTNISVSALERYIKQLRKVGLIEFRGAPKTGGYYLSPRE